MHIYLDMFKAVLKDVWISDICDALVECDIYKEHNGKQNYELVAQQLYKKALGDKHVYLVKKNDIFEILADEKHAFFNVTNIRSYLPPGNVLKKPLKIDRVPREFVQEFIKDICEKPDSDWNRIYSTARRLAQAKNRNQTDQLTQEMVADEYVLSYYTDRLKELR